MYEIILASKSPRRRQILEERGYNFRIFPVEISEIPKKNLRLTEQICDLARQKAESVVPELKSLESGKKIVLSADTVVIFQGKILGKPKSEAEAIETLGHLSGCDHQVITAFCLWNLYDSQVETDFETSYVEFHRLEKQQILDYVKTGEPMDKAGSYGIQGQARAFVKKYEGSFNNIVGLPIEKIEKVVASHGWNLKKESHSNRK